MYIRGSWESPEVRSKAESRESPPSARPGFSRWIRRSRPRFAWGPAYEGHLAVGREADLKSNGRAAGSRSWLEGRHGSKRAWGEDKIVRAPGLSSGTAAGESGTWAKQPGGAGSPEEVVEPE